MRTVEQIEKDTKSNGEFEIDALLGLKVANFLNTSKYGTGTTGTQIFTYLLDDDGRRWCLVRVHNIISISSL